MDGAGSQARAAHPLGPEGPRRRGRWYSRRAGAARREDRLAQPLPGIDLTLADARSSRPPMMKSLIRFAAIWGLSHLLTPHLNRLWDRVLARTSQGSLLQDVVWELRDKHSTTILRSFGETAGDLVFGPKGKGRG